MIFYKETEFQETPIGKIPKDWDVQELGDESIADIIAGQSPPSSTYNKENLGLPFLQGKMEFGEMFPSPTTYCSEPIKVAKKGDILLSVRAPVGDVNIAPFECCIGRGLAAIRAKADKLDPIFLFYYLKLEGKRFEALSTGSTFKAIRMHEIERFSIPLPSAKEQKSIAEVLGVVDSVIGLVDRVILKTERLKKGLMQTLLTRGIGHTEYKQTPIGTTSKEWDLVKLGDLSETITKGTTPTTFGFNFTNFGIKFIKVESIDEHGNFIPENVSYIDEEANKALSRSILKENDILFSIAGALGRVAIVTKEILPANVNQALAIIRLKRNAKLSLKYLEYYLRGPFIQDYIKTIAVQSAQANLTLAQVKDFLIALPSPSEQQQITEILSTLDKKLVLEKKEKTRLERIKRGLMDLLLTGKVRIKVD